MVPRQSGETERRTGLRLSNSQLTRSEYAAAQDDIADSFFIISKGQVEVVYTDAAGLERSVARLDAGEYFGEIGLIQREGRRIATVRALNSVEVLRMHRLVFSRLLNNSTSSKEAIEQAVARRSAHVNA